jgi:hypothetical protein
MRTYPVTVEQAGRQWAASQVQSLDYSDLVEIAKLRLGVSSVDPIPQLPWSDAESYFGMLPEWVQVQFSNQMDPESEGSEPPQAFYDDEAWAFAWLRYVQEWWADIKDEI